MDYFEKRRTDIKDITKEQINDVFGVIAETFSQKWLNNKSGANPLQLLWNRQDLLSTIELYNFGVSLKRMVSIDKKWVKDQVTQVKSDHKNNQRGAIFEIFALGALRVETQGVTPAKGNNPGFDGLLQISNTKKMRISLKSYGISSHEIEFNNYAAKFESEFKAEIKKRNIHSIQLFVDAYKETPSPEKWKALIKKIPEILDKYDFNQRKLFEIDDFWSIILLKINDDKEYHEAYNSYYLLISSELHKNEYQNMFEKLDGACENLVKHEKLEDENTVNAVFVHMPQNISIVRCLGSVAQYFERNPNKEITCVILYQPSVVSDVGYKNSHINHCFFIFSKGNRLQTFLGTETQLLMEIPVGHISGVPSSIHMVPQNGGGQVFKVDDKYLFQRGNFYIKAKPTPEGNIEGVTNKPAPGLIMHCVARIPPNKKDIVFSPKLPLDDTLLIN